MHNDVPFPVITWEVFYIPPIFIELSVSKPQKLSPNIAPALEYTVEESK
jgi:hypothetical protein